MTSPGEQPPMENIQQTISGTSATHGSAAIAGSIQGPVNISITRQYSQLEQDSSISFGQTNADLISKTRAAPTIEESS